MQAKPISAHVTLPIHSLLWVQQPNELRRLLCAQPGVKAVRLDLASGVAHVALDPARTSVRQLRDFVDDCAHHCRGDQAHAHLCPPSLNDD
jgi:Cu2+-exporting ATPase